MACSTRCLWVLPPWRGPFLPHTPSRAPQGGVLTLSWSLCQASESYSRILEYGEFGAEKCPHKTVAQAGSRPGDTLPVPPSELFSRGVLAAAGCPKHCSSHRSLPALLSPCRLGQVLGLQAAARAGKAPRVLVHAACVCWGPASLCPQLSPALPRVLRSLLPGPEAAHSFPRARSHALGGPGGAPGSGARQGFH